MNLSDELKKIFEEVEHKHIDFLKELVFESTRKAIKELEKEIKRGNDVFPLDWYFDSIEKIFGEELSK